MFLHCICPLYCVHITLSQSQKTNTENTSLKINKSLYNPKTNMKQNSFYDQKFSLFNNSSLCHSSCTMHIMEYNACLNYWLTNHSKFRNVKLLKLNEVLNYFTHENLKKKGKLTWRTEVDALPGFRASSLLFNSSSLENWEWLLSWTWYRKLCQNQIVKAALLNLTNTSPKYLTRLFRSSHSFCFIASSSFTSCDAASHAWSTSHIDITTEATW